MDKAIFVSNGRTADLIALSNINTCQFYTDKIKNSKTKTLNIFYNKNTLVIVKIQDTATDENIEFNAIPTAVLNDITEFLDNKYSKVRISSLKDRVRNDNLKPNALALVRQGADWSILTKHIIQVMVIDDYIIDADNNILGKMNGECVVPMNKSIRYLALVSQDIADTYYKLLAKHIETSKRAQEAKGAWLACKEQLMKIF